METETSNETGASNNDKVNDSVTIVWRWDEDVWEGKINGTHYFAVEPTKKGATVYQMKKRVGNFIDLPSVEKAKEYCEVVLAKQYLQ